MLCCCSLPKSGGGGGGGEKGWHVLFSGHQIGGQQGPTLERRKGMGPPAAPTAAAAAAAADKVTLSLQCSET